MNAFSLENASLAYTYSLLSQSVRCERRCPILEETSRLKKVLVALVVVNLDAIPQVEMSQAAMGLLPRGDDVSTGLLTITPT